MTNIEIRRVAAKARAAHLCEPVSEDFNDADGREWLRGVAAFVDGDQSALGAPARDVAEREIAAIRTGKE